LQKQNLHSAFWRRSVLLGPISVILGTTQEGKERCFSDVPPEGL
jgi:hypothetical protein